VQNTALHYACYGGHVEAVQLLLEYKANVAVKNTYEQSPLDHAIDNMNSDVVTIMLRNKRRASAWLLILVRKQQEICTDTSSTTQLNSTQLNLLRNGSPRAE